MASKHRRSSEAGTPSSLSETFRSLLQSLTLTVEETDGRVERIQGGLQADFLQAFSRFQIRDETTLNRFFQDLEALVQSVSSLRALLRPVAFRSDSSSQPEQPSSEGDSLFRILLKLDSLQPRTVNLLLEFVGRYSTVDPQRELTGLLLRQLRGLDYIVEPLGLKDQLMVQITQSVNAGCHETAHDLVLLLADLVPLTELQDSGDVQDLLTTVLDADNKDLIGSTFGLLADLPSKPTTLKAIRTTLEPSLNSIDVTQQVGYFTMMVAKVAALQSVPNKTEWVELFRQFHSVIVRNVLDSQDSSDVIQILLGKLEDLCRYRKGVLQELLLYYKGVSALEPGDLWVLLILYSLAPEDTLRVARKKADVIEKATVSASFDSAQVPLRHYLNDIIVLASSLFKEPSEGAQRVGSYLFESVIHHFPETQLQVISQLINFTRQNYLPAADLLFSLSSTEEGLSLLYSCSSYFSPLKYQLSGLREDVQYKICVILFRLSENQASGLSREELEIFIQKRLSQSHLDYQREGVLFAVALMEQESQMHRFKVKFWQRIWSLCRSNESKEYLFRQLLRSVQQELLADDYKEFFNGILEELLSLFVQETVDPIPIPDLPLRLTKEYGLDDPSLHLSFQLANAVHHPTERFAIKTYFFPMVELLLLVRRVLDNGSLQSLNALLGCPVVGFDMATVVTQFDSFVTELKQQIQDVVYYTLYWFRILLSFFGSEEEDEATRNKCKERLRQCFSLQQELVDLAAMGSQKKKRSPKKQPQNLAPPPSPYLLRLANASDSDETLSYLLGGADKWLKPILSGPLGYYRRDSSAQLMSYTEFERFFFPKIFRVLKACPRNLDAQKLVALVLNSRAVRRSPLCDDFLREWADSNSAGIELYQECFERALSLLDAETEVNLSLVWLSLLRLFQDHMERANPALSLETVRSHQSSITRLVQSDFASRIPVKLLTPAFTKRLVALVVALVPSVALEICSEMPQKTDGFPEGGLPTYSLITKSTVPYVYPVLADALAQQICLTRLNKEDLGSALNELCRQVQGYKSLILFSQLKQHAHIFMSAARSALQITQHFNSKLIPFASMASNHIFTNYTDLIKRIIGCCVAYQKQIFPILTLLKRSVAPKTTKLVAKIKEAIEQFNNLLITCYKRNHVKCDIDMCLLKNKDVKGGLVGDASTS